MKTTKEVREKIERYIIDCIDTSGYDDIQRSEKDRLRFVWDCFNKEYGNHQMKYHNNNLQDCFVGWLQGLPSVFNIDFENYEILKKGREWEFLPPLISGQTVSISLKKIVDRKEGKFLETWWAVIYMRFQAMLKREPKRIILRKTKDEFVLLANYGQGFEEETIEDSFKEIRERLKEYRSNAPQYEYTYKKRRVKL